MTLGMWIDYIIEWNYLHDPKDKTGDDTGKKEKSTRRQARQADFDSF